MRDALSKKPAIHPELSLIVKKEIIASSKVSCEACALIKTTVRAPCYFRFPTYVRCEQDRVHGREFFVDENSAARKDGDGGARPRKKSKLRRKEDGEAPLNEGLHNPRLNLTFLPHLRRSRANNEGRSRASRQGSQGR